MTAGSVGIEAFGSLSTRSRLRSRSHSNGLRMIAVSLHTYVRSRCVADSKGEENDMDGG